MALLKCGQTGHFFGYFADTDVGFTCSGCFENFAPSGRRQRTSWVPSRKRLSSHLPPIPPQNTQEVLSGSDENGRRRSKPWRCLQQKCHILACEECAEKLIDPNYVPKADPVKQLEQPSLTKTAKTLSQAGAATPPEHRASRELKESSQRPSRPINTATATATAAVDSVNVAHADKGLTDPDSEDSSSDVDTLRSQLVYRRAGQFSNSFLGGHHRPQGRGTASNRDQVKEAVQQIPKRPTVIPENMVSSGSGALLEVDSNEDTEEEIDMEAFRSKYAVRSATQAANQSVRDHMLGPARGGVYCSIPCGDGINVI